MAEATPSPLSRAMRRTACSDASWFRLAISTREPRRASSRAHSKPIPEFPPVTSTTPSAMAASDRVDDDTAEPDRPS